MFHFSAIVSKDHLFKFLAMHASLCGHFKNYRLFVLCVDEVAAKVLQAIPLKNTTLINMKELENEKVLKARQDRIFHAFCWTLKPVFLHYVVEHFPEAKYFAHLDSDLYFFSSLEPLFGENPEASLYLTHHRNSLKYMSFYPLTGIFNTGFVGVRRDEHARKALSRWKDQCLAYCPIKEDPEKRLFGDQRYVEEWPVNYPGVHVVRSLGANTAMWNIDNYHVSLRDGKVHINGDPLLFYHFSGLSIVSSTEFSLSWFHPVDEKAVNLIYKPYLKTLSTAIREVSKYFTWFHEGFVDRSQVPDVNFYSYLE